jgi:hypothetical protein
MIHIEPLHTGVILPAFVIGYELSESARPTRPLQELPPWVVTLDQQAGGYGISYPSVVGAVMRLDANGERGKKDIARLIRGIRCMAEDPDMATLRRDYPVLSRLVGTHGSEYAKNELRDLDNILNAYFWLPPLAGGIEAFLRFADCDPLDHFQDWKMLRCRVRRDGLRRGSVYTLPGSDSYHVDESNLSDLEMADDVVYDAKRQRELMKLGEELAKPGLPGVFFLWENSD